MKTVGLGMSLPMDSFSVSDLDEETGTCRFVVCKTDDLSDAVLKKIRPFIDEDGLHLKISGTTLMTVPGYALSYSIASDH